MLIHNFANVKVGEYGENEAIFSKILVGKIHQKIKCVTRVFPQGGQIGRQGGQKTI